MRNWTIRDHSDDTLLEAIERNVIEHKTFIASRHPAMKVQIENDLILVDSNTFSDKRNYIFTVKYSPESILLSLKKGLEYFEKNKKPFSFVLGPTLPQDELSKILKDHGLKCSFMDECMIMNLSYFSKKASYIRGFQIHQVLSNRQLKDFEKVLRNSTQPEKTEDFFKLLENYSFSSSDPERLFVGYLNNKPVIASELYLGAGIAGLSVFVSKDIFDDSRDFIVDITTKMLLLAKRSGYHYAVVKTVKSFCYFFNQLGFKNYCRFNYYQ